jgi:glycerol-3-phosphate acyltransferase PlsY
MLDGVVKMNQIVCSGKTAVHESSEILIVALSYAAGSFQTGLVVARARSIDLLAAGSRNPGAVNVARTAGWTAGAVTLAGDMMKAFIPTLLCRLYLFPDRPGLWCACGLAAMTGHLLPFFPGFKGGKGVASALGVMAALEPWAAAAGFGTFALLLTTTRRASLGSLAGTFVSFLCVMALSSPSEVLLCHAVLLLAIVVCHRDNLRRLVEGRELRV